MTRSTVDAKFLRKIQINWSGGDEEDESKPTPTVNAFSSSEFSHFSKVGVH